MANIVAKLKRVRKDGGDITFTNYKGEKQTSRFAPCATFFKNERGMISVVFEKGFTASDEEYVNYYPEDGSRGERGGNRGGGRGRPAPEGDDVPF
jgi:hypothetical protein